MANYSITIQNSINAFGPAPTTKWGTGTSYSMTWGTSKWGEGTQDHVALVVKLLSNSIDATDAFPKHASKLIENLIIPTEDLSSESVTDGQGYTLVFPGNVTNAENRVLSTYSTAAAGSITYSSSTAGNTVWS